MKKIIFIIFAVFFFCSRADAATIEFSKPPADIHVGDVFDVTLLLDSGNASINTLSGDIKSAGAFDIEKVRDGGSFVPLWIENPRIENGVVSFSGLIPGGFSGVLGPYWTGKRPGQVLTFTIRANSAGSGSISASLDTLLANDGSATPVSVSPISLSLFATPGIGKIFNVINDRDPPEPFNVEVSDGWGDFASEKVALFSTYDEKSGISHYMVKEGDGEFATATSPYILKDGGKSALVVRAYDNSGNYREALWDKVTSGGIGLTSFSGFGFWVIIIVLLACAALFLNRSSRKSS